ncbi:hypothetical protein HYY75_09300 [bacterium]|nr:hypothetical protein [bacterium]
MLFDENDVRLMPGKTNIDGILLVSDGNSYPAILRDSEDNKSASATLKLQNIAMVVGARPDDSSFIELSSNRFRPFNATQVSESKVTVRNRTGHIFTERGIYKPGEIVFWKAAVRKFEKNAVVAPGGEKVQVEITSSRGDTLLDDELAINSYGTCSGSFQLKEFHPFGEYSVKLKIRKPEETKTEKQPRNNDDEEEESDYLTLAQVGFQVMEFERPRHFVTVKLEKKSWENTSFVGKKITEDYLECRLEGKYYTGGMLKFAKVRWTAHLAPVQMKVSGFDAFHFGNDSAEKSLIESGEALLDKEGVLNIHIPLDKRLMSGLFGVEVSATVLDVDARPATGVGIYEPTPNVKVGIQFHPKNIPSGETLPLRVIAVDNASQKLNFGVVRLEILRKRYFYNQKRDAEGNIFYRYESAWTKTLSSEMPIKDGQAFFEMRFVDGGDYQIQAVYTTPEGEFVSKTSLDVGWDYSYQEEDEDGRRHAKSEREIILMASQGEVSINDKVKVDFNVPRPATHALITCERGALLEHRVIQIDGRRGNFEMTMGPNCAPNVFVTVTVPAGREGFPVYRTQIDQNLPTTYYGVTNIKVKNQLSALKVAIQAQDPELKGRPGEFKKFNLYVTDKNGKGAVSEMAVCVVDEAVLALTGYVTPVLSSLANFTLPLSVFSGDLRLSLISQELFRIFATNALTGGGMGNGAIASDLSLRKDFRPVAYWNPALMSDSNGNASFEFTLPDTTTAYRIYVVALDAESSFCSAERKMVVTKEFFMQPGLPRFLTAGDKAVFPISACNKSGNSGEAMLSITEAKNLSVRLKENKASMTPFSNTVVSTELEADNGAGEGAIIVSGNFGAFSDAIQQTLPIVPRHLPIQRMKIGHFTDRAEISFDFPPEIASLSKDELNGALKATLGISTTSWTKIAPGLKYLLHYPYGCVEQTSSGIIPLAGLRKLVAEGLIPGLTVSEVDKFLKPGIRRLFGMQTGTGGFAYWPGDRETSWWGTLYATFALSTAKSSGCEIADGRFNQALDYIHKNLFGEHKGTNIHQYGIDELAPVNLAINGRLKKENLEVLMKEFEKRSLEGKAYLLWADNLIGLHPPSERKEMQMKLNPKFASTRVNWNDSSTREIAATLISETLIDPASKRADDFAGNLLGELKPEGRWYSTADTGWCLYALGQYFQKRTLSDALETKVKVTQPELNPVEFSIGRTSTEIKLDAEAFLKSGKFSIESSGGKMVNWNLSLTYPNTASRTEDLDQGFSVEKRIKNLNGNEEIKVGDIVKVTIEIEDDLHRKQKYGNYEYVALEDPLPAGFVAINSALKTEQKTVVDEGGDEVILKCMTIGFWLLKTGCGPEDFGFPTLLGRFAKGNLGLGPRKFH